MSRINSNILWIRESIFPLFKQYTWTMLQSNHYLHYYFNKRMVAVSIICRPIRMAWFVGLLQYRTSLRISPQTEFSGYLVEWQSISQLPNRFEILHRARQWYCRALCNKSNRLGNWHGCCGGMIFCELCLESEFPRDILYWARHTFFGVRQNKVNKMALNYGSHNGVIFTYHKPLDDD